jgi:hypothetical protein
VIDTWIVDWQRDERLPYYTRANAGEVLQDPASPLGWSLVFEEGLLPGWFRGFVEFGIYAEDEMSGPKYPVVGVFGGFFYLNLSHMRLLGLRLGPHRDEGGMNALPRRARCLHPGCAAAPTTAATTRAGAGRAAAPRRCRTTA